MELESILIGIAFILICMAPFVIININTKKHAKQTLQLLSSYALENNSKVTLKEFCGDFAIGLDDTQNKLFFVKENVVDKQSICVDLNTIEACVSNTVKRSAKDATSAITAVGLGFIPRSKNQKETILPLYNERINIQLTGEVQFAEKWSKTINARLKSKSS